MWFLYLLYSDVLARFYCGIARRPHLRLRAHNGLRAGARSTRAGRPWRIVYLEVHRSHGDALRAERAWKRKTAAEKAAAARGAGLPLRGRKGF